MSVIGDRLKTDVKSRLTHERWDHINDSPHFQDMLTAICEAVADEISSIHTPYNMHTHVSSSPGSPTATPNSPMS